MDTKMLPSVEQLNAREWLVRNDPDGADYWRSLPDDSDFVGAKRDNLRDFGCEDVCVDDCLLCNGPLVPLGKLASLNWYRCQDCGMNQAEATGEDPNASDEDDQDALL